VRTELFHILQICLGSVQTMTVEAEVPLLERQEGTSHRITA